MFETWNAMGAMLQTSAVLRDAIGSIISERMPATEWERGFEAAASAHGGKVILDWTVM
jgi:threonine 3-dehydrogenase